MAELNIFRFECENDNGEWIDTFFSDPCPKSLRREWVLCRNTITGEAYGALLRSDTDDGGFEFSVILPRKMVEALRNAL